MSDEKNPKNMSNYTSETRLQVFESSLYDSSVRLEDFNFQEILYIHEKTTVRSLQFNESTLFCLRDVLNRWYEATEIKPKERE